MEVNARFRYGLLRNPLFIAGFLLLSVVPEVAAYCNSLWSAEALASCGQEAIRATYLQSSFLSFSVVLVAFESQRFYFQSQNLLTVPASLRQWAKAHTGLLLVSGVAFVVYVGVSAGVQWVAGDALEVMDLLHPGRILRVMGIVFLSFYALTWYSKRKSKQDPLKQVLHTDKEQPLLLEEIRYFTKEDRKYWVCTREGNRIPLSVTLQQFEDMAPAEYFARINRSTVVRLQDVASYNYWEHEKYILKLHSGEEFVITRKRLNQVKKLLGRG